VILFFVLGGIVLTQVAWQPAKEATALEQ